MSRFTVAVVLAVLFLAPVAAAETRRFEATGQLLGEAEWLSVFGQRIAFGSGDRVFLARTDPLLQVERELRTRRPLVDGVLSWNRLYLNDGKTIRVLDLSAAVPQERPVRLDPEPRGALRLARHGDNLVLSERGAGLRFVTLPAPMPEHRHMFPDEPTQVGALALPRKIVALTSFAHRVYAALEGGGIVVIDGFDPARPRQLREFAFEDDVRSLAVTGSQLFVLGDEGLTVLDLSEADGAPVGATHTEVHGRALGLAGRGVLVAGGNAGLLTFRDKTPLATTHTVNILGITFNPSSLTVNSGDTVQWVHAGGLPHNVESCDGVADPVQCSGVAVEGQFVTPFPMPVIGAAFTVSHTFTPPGANPYFCVVHVGFNMTGTVNVSAPPPPGVPSGASGTPLLVSKLPGFPDGSRLDLTYDATSCAGNTDHQIVHAPGSGLPSVLGDTYFPSGGVCNIGSSGSHTWSGVPAPAEPLLWFLVLSEDNSGIEGAWGQDSAGGERNGSSAGGSSGQCGITTKSLANTCGTP